MYFLFSSVRGVHRDLFLLMESNFLFMLICLCNFFLLGYTKSYIDYML